MKKILSIILIISLIISFTGCVNGSEFTIGSIENNTLSSMSMKYLKFSGNKNTRITVKEGEIYEVSVDINTEEGKIDLFITGENDSKAYEGHDLQTSSFTITLDEPGTYKLRLEAKDHKGSYAINWKVK